MSEPNNHDSHELDLEEKSKFRDMAALWMQSQPAVALFLSALIRDPHAVDDIHQEVAQTVVEKFESYDRTRPFTPWVLGIARICAAKHLRTSHRQPIVFDEHFINKFAEEIPRIEPELEERKLALKKCIESLRGTAKRIVTLRYLHEMGMDAVSKDVGLTINAVRVALHRARNMLADCIDRQMARNR